LLNEKVKSGQSEIMLTVKRQWGSRNYRSLFGVKGEIITEMDDNRLMCAFPAADLLKAVIKQLPHYTMKGE
jgi:hypothetical protein